MPRHISTTVLSKKLGVTSRELFAEFEKLEWITSDRNLTVDGFSIGAIYKEITKEGETIKYIAWPEDIKIGIKPQDVSLITATKLGHLCQLSALQINHILAEIAWTKKGELNKGWIATQQGISIGAIAAEDAKSGIPYLRWPAIISKNPIFIEAVDNFKGKPKNNINDHKLLTFRERFPLKYQSTDGHLMRSAAEVHIDNWLYLFGIAHAYERKLPIKEEVYSGFYIPTGRVYIEYFGCENDDSFGYDTACGKRKQKKLAIYTQYDLNVIVLEDTDIKKLDEVLPKLLLKYGVQTY